MRAPASTANASAVGWRLIYLAMAAFVLASSRWSFADGGPVQVSPVTGLMRFAHSHEAALTHKHVTITVRRDGPVIVRAEYDLALNERETPLAVLVAWPIGEGLPPDEEDYYTIYPSIKFDGRPVAYSFLDFSRLAHPYLKPVVARVNQWVASQPTLDEKVCAICTAGRQQEFHPDDPDAWVEDKGAPELAAWMKANGYAKLAEHAHGLLVARLYQGRVMPTEYEYVEGVQCALSHLDPGYEEVDITELVSDQWGFQALAVDPRTGRLIENDTSGKPGAVFLFSITLEPGKKHRLVIQYKQWLGSQGSDPPDGMVYQMMKPSAAWALTLTDTPRGHGYGQPAEIEIRIPRERSRVAIRPPARKIGVRQGYTIYRITMNEPPLEDLYIGLDD